MRVRSRRGYGLLAAIVLLGVVSGVPAIRGSILRAAGWALVVDDPVEPADVADVIVVPEWAGAAGVIEASDLFHRGFAQRVALLPEPQEPAEEELVRRGVSYVDRNVALVQLLRSLGVANVDVIPDPAAGTDAEGQVLLSWCDQRQFRSVLVVSSPDHSRRVRRVLRRSLRGHPTTLRIRSARNSSFDPDRWWMTRVGARTAIVELEKLLLDVVRHPMP
jgi:hypothetical protein